MNFSTIILGFEPVKKDNKIIVYGVIEEIKLVVSRTIKLDDYSDPCKALESLFQDDETQEKYAVKPFSLPNDDKWTQDKEELLTAFYMHDAGKLPEEKKLLSSVTACLIRIGYIDLSVDELLTNCKILGSYSNIRKICNRADTAFAIKYMQPGQAIDKKNQQLLEEIDKRIAK